MGRAVNLCVIVDFTGLQSSAKRGWVVPADIIYENGVIETDIVVASVFVEDFVITNEYSMLK